jgi:hypothetical protein
VLAGLAVSIYAAAAVALPGGVSGTVLDALTGRPVKGAVVGDGKNAVAITDRQGQFELRDLPGAVVDVIVQHPAYVIFAQVDVSVGSRVEIKVQPSSIEAEQVEIVETREEDLRPMLVRQDPIELPPEYLRGLRATAGIKGLYRVCVGKDGKVSLVTPIVRAGDADPYVIQGIAKGWEYRALQQPACFYWRVAFKFKDRSKLLPPAPSTGQSTPPGSPFRPR